MRVSLLCLLLGVSFPSYSQLYECQGVSGYSNIKRGGVCKVVRGFKISVPQAQTSLVKRDAPVVESPPPVVNRVVLEASPPVVGVSAASAVSAGSSSGSRVVTATRQLELDSEALGVLKGELRKVEGRLSELRGRFQDGMPERFPSEVGDDVAYQKRVAEMKADIGRLEGDVASIQREIALHKKKMHRLSKRG